MSELKTERERLPRWMKSPLPKGESYLKVKRLIADHHLNTICTSGNCPNKGECWSAGTASFMILGDYCPTNWLNYGLRKVFHTKRCVGR